MDDPPTCRVPRPVPARWTLVGLAALSCGLLTHACTKTEVVGVTGGSVSVGPSSWTAPVGDTVMFSAEVRDDQGRLIPNVEVTWSSSRPTLLSVSSEGWAEALEPGTAEVRATALGVTGTAAVTIEPAPSIVVQPGSASFFVDVGADPPGPAELAITNGGSGLLSGLAANVEYGPGQPAGWLDLGLSSTDAPATLTLEGNTSNLPVGGYDARIVLTSPAAPGSPVEVPVELSVTEDVPILQVNPGAVGFAAVAGGPPPAPTTVRVLNGGAGTLDGLSVDVIWVEGPAGWLTGSLSREVAPADLTLVPDAGTLGDGTWRADVSVSAPGVINSPRTISVTFSVEPEPVADLAVTKAGPARVEEDDTLDFLLSLTNRGPREATGVQLVDSLPEVFDFVSASGQGSRSPGEVSWSLGTVPAGETVERTVRVVATSVGHPVNVARARSAVRDTVEANDRDTLAVEVVARPSDLSVRKEGPATAELGDTVVYVITTSNAGPGPAADVVVVDSLPRGTTALSTSNGGVRAGTAVTWNVDTLRIGGSRVDSVRVRVDAAGELTDVARTSTTGRDPDLSDNRSAVTTVVARQADLLVAKSGPDRVAVGDTILYVITVSNGGPDEAREVEVVDSLPDDVVYLSATGGGVRNGGTVTWTLDTFGPGETVTDTLRVQPLLPGERINVVRASSATADPDSADLRAEVETDVEIVEGEGAVVFRGQARHVGFEEEPALDLTAADHAVPGDGAGGDGIALVRAPRGCGGGEGQDEQTLERRLDLRAREGRWMR